MDDYENIRLVTQPVNLPINLFKHQLASIYQMEKLEREQCVELEGNIKETRLGVNADATGYGKTLSMIGLIMRDKMEWDLGMPFAHETVTIEAAGLICNRVIKRYERLPATLILISPSIVNQWEKELAYTNLKVATLTTKKDVDQINVENYDVILVTVSMYNTVAMTYSKYAWKRMIFDEPGHMRVPGMKEIRAGFFWFVTATPSAITSQHRMCRGSFMKQIIGDSWWDFEVQFAGIILANSINFVHSSFNMPPTHNHYYKCFQPVLKTLSGMINKTVNTMIEAGNIEGAIAAIGGTKTQNIVELVKQKKLEELEEIEAQIRIYKLRCDTTKENEWEDKKRRMISQVNEIDSRFKELLDGPCHICLEKMKNPILEPACQNMFCGECLLTWLQNSDNCPLCRSDVDPTNLVYIPDKDTTKNDKQKSTRQMTKLERLKDLISRKKDGRFLIFSSYDITFEPINKLLKENDISFAVVKGTIKARQKSIEMFKNGQIKVILLNANFNGAGINLQEATDIILYHEMNSSTKNQIIGRANRIGRTEPLHVHHLQVQT